MAWFIGPRIVFWGSKVGPLIIAWAKTLSNCSQEQQWSKETIWGSVPFQPKEPRSGLQQIQKRPRVTSLLSWLSWLPYGSHYIRGLWSLWKPYKALKGHIGLLGLASLASWLPVWGIVDIDAEDTNTPTASHPVHEHPDSAETQPIVTDSMIPFLQVMSELGGAEAMTSARKTPEASQQKADEPADARHF